MATIILAQQNNDIHVMIKNLLAISKTNLSRVCREHDDLNYNRTVKSLEKEKIELDFLKDLIYKIDPEARIEVDVNITLFANGQLIFTQKTEK